MLEGMDVDKLKIYVNNFMMSLANRDSFKLLFSRITSKEDAECYLNIY